MFLKAGWKKTPVWNKSGIDGVSSYKYFYSIVIIQDNVSIFFGKIVTNLPIHYELMFKDLYLLH